MGAMGIAELETSTLALAIIPPIVAICVERFNPITDTYVRSSVERDFSRFDDTSKGAAQSSADRLLLIDIMVKSNMAAAEISGLAPTIVTSITSCFAVVHELREPFWALVLYAVFFVILIILVARNLGGKTLFQMDNLAALSFRHPITKKRLAFTSVRVTSWTIYGANLALILAAVLVFALTRHESSASTPGSTKSSTANGTVASAAIANRSTGICKDAP